MFNIFKKKQTIIIENLKKEFFRDFILFNYFQKRNILRSSGFHRIIGYHIDKTFEDSLNKIKIRELKDHFNVLYLQLLENEEFKFDNDIFKSALDGGYKEIEYLKNFKKTENFEYDFNNVYIKVNEKFKSFITKISEYNPLFINSLFKTLKTLEESHFGILCYSYQEKYQLQNIDLLENFCEYIIKLSNKELVQEFKNNVFFFSLLSFIIFQYFHTLNGKFGEYLKKIYFSGISEYIGEYFIMFLNMKNSFLKSIYFIDFFEGNNTEQLKENSKNLSSYLKEKLKL